VTTNSERGNLHKNNYLIPYIKRCYHCIHFSMPLFPHQVSGVQWLANALKQENTGVIIADDPGAGKTRMTIALLQTLGRKIGEVLLIVPLSVISHWYAEFIAMSWAKGDVFIYHPDHPARDHKQPRPWVTITTYRIFESHELIRKGPWPCIVFDEATILKEADSNVSLAAKELGNTALRRIMITGTPTQKNLSELHTLFSIIRPSILGDADIFKKFFDEPVRLGTHPSAMETDRIRACKLLMVLQRLVKPHILRRDIVKPFNKKMTAIWTPMRKTEEKLYKETLKDMRTRRSGTSRSKASVYARDAALGRVTSGVHEKFFDENERAGSPVCAKHDTILALLDTCFGGTNQDNRVAIFTHHIALLEWVVNAVRIRFPSIPVDIIHGGINSNTRKDVIQRFNSGQLRLLVLTTRSSCYGINLRCETVIIAQCDWNAAVDEQAAARAHRADSKCSVDVYLLITSKTVEERVYNRKLQETLVNNTLLSGLTESMSTRESVTTIDAVSIPLRLPTDMTVVSYDDVIDDMKLDSCDFDEVCKNYEDVHKQREHAKKAKSMRMADYIKQKLVTMLAAGPKSSKVFIAYKNRQNFECKQYRACLHAVATLNRKTGMWSLRAKLIPTS
jgi:SNF2 family DNA or RNA helicase